MTPQKKQVPSFTGVKPGEYCTGDWPQGILLHSIDLEIKAACATGGVAGTAIGVAGTGTGGGRTLAEAIDFIELRLNGVAQQVWTGAEIGAQNLLNGAQFSVSTTGTGVSFTTYLRLFFNQNFRKDSMLGRAFGWNLNDNPNAPGTGDFQLAVKFNANCGLVPSITGSFKFVESKNPIGSVMKVKRISQDALGSSRDYSKLLDLGDSSKAQRLYVVSFYPPSGTVCCADKITFDYDGKRYLDAIRNVQNQFDLRLCELNPDVAAVPRYDIVFDALDPLQDALLLRQGAQHNFKVEFASTADGAAAAANGTMIVQLQYSGLPD